MKRKLLTAAVLLLALVCTAGAIWTAWWSIRFGLTPRPPLPPLQTALRIAIVTLAFVLLWSRREAMERIALACTIVAAGASALFGLGLRSTVNDAVRLLFHFFAYLLGAMLCARWLVGRASARR
jgi:hypothetical protein